jgi:hypothetical protein
MKRTFGALAVALLLLILAPGAYAEDLCGSDPNCFVDDSYSSDAFADGGVSSGMPGLFVAFFVLAAAASVIGVIYKVTMARDLARKAGMDEGTATAMTLLDEDGLTATYLASSLKQPSPVAATSAHQPKSADERLSELRSLLDRGLVTQAEHDARRQAIIDSI